MFQSVLDTTFTNINSNFPYKDPLGKDTPNPVPNTDW